MTIKIMRVKFTYILFCLIIIQSQIFPQNQKMTKEDFFHKKNLLELRKLSLLKEQNYLNQIYLKLNHELDSLRLELNKCQDSLYNINESRIDELFKNRIELKEKYECGNKLAESKLIGRMINLYLKIRLLNI